MLFGNKFHRRIDIFIITYLCGYNNFFTDFFKCRLPNENKENLQQATLTKRICINLQDFKKNFNNFFQICLNLFLRIQLVCRIVLINVLSMLFKNCKKKNFLLLAETTGEIVLKTLRSYLRIVHRKNVSLV